MDFKKDKEQTSYKAGQKIGFWISYIIFFSIMFYVLSRFHLLPIKYLYFILTALIFGVVAKVIGYSLRKGMPS